MLHPIQSIEKSIKRVTTANPPLPHSFSLRNPCCLCFFVFLLNFDDVGLRMPDAGYFFFYSSCFLAFFPSLPFVRCPSLSILPSARICSSAAAICESLSVSLHSARCLPLSFPRVLLLYIDSLGRILGIYNLNSTVFIGRS